jgi:hypothetical protein
MGFTLGIINTSRLWLSFILPKQLASGLLVGMNLSERYVDR